MNGFGLMNVLTGHERVIWIGLILCALPGYFHSQPVGADAQDRIIFLCKVLRLSIYPSKP